jgi:hypothetical protein
MSRRTLIALAAILLPWSLSAQEAPGRRPLIPVEAGPREHPRQVTGLSTEDATPEDGFGNALAFLPEGGLAVGAPQTSVDGLSGKGAAYLFRVAPHAPWTLDQRLGGVSRNVIELFGTALAASGPRLAVSAPGDQRVYIMGREEDGTWRQWGDALKPVIGGKAFGGSLAMSENWLAVGDSKGVYLYRWEPDGIGARTGTFTYLKRLSLTGIGGGACQVALHGDTLLVGCLLQRSTSGAEIGGAALFTQDLGGADNWGKAQELPLPAARGNAALGSSVALEGRFAAVGSRSGGAVYIYEEGARGFELKAAPTLREGGKAARLGAGLAVHGGYVIAGAPGEEVNGEEAQGAVYVFAPNAGGAGNWGTVARWISAEGHDQDNFGAELAAGYGRVGIGGARRSGGEPVLVYLADLPAPTPDQADLGLAEANLATLEERLKPPARPAPEPVEAPATAFTETGETPAGTAAKSPTPPAEIPFVRDRAAPGFKPVSSQVIPLPREAGPGFGQGLALSPDGRLLAVGEPGAGRAHVYERRTDGAWGRVAILPHGPDALALNQFGQEISLGETGLLAVGGEGVAEVWLRLGDDARQWARLKLPKGADVGSSLAVWRDWVALGQPAAGEAGEVRVLRLNRETAELAEVQVLRRTGNVGARFGTALAWEPDGGLAVSAPRAESRGVMRTDDSRGTVNLFRPTEAGDRLAPAQELRSPGREMTGTFGASLAVSDRFLLVGDPIRTLMDARRPGRMNAGQGAVMLYELDQANDRLWEPVGELTSAEGQEGRGFGVLVAISTAPEPLWAVLGNSPKAPEKASLHLFRQNAHGRWLEAAMLSRPEGAGEAVVWGGLALAGRTVAVGLRGPDGQLGGVWVTEWP